jgi:hypothetical protein
MADKPQQMLCPACHEGATEWCGAWSVCTLCKGTMLVDRELGRSYIECVKIVASA